MDEVIALAAGSISTLNQMLGTEFVASEPLYRIDVRHPLRHNARVASGSESGANRYFQPGGFTCGGVPEIVTDPIDCPGSLRLEPLVDAPP